LETKLKGALKKGYSISESKNYFPVINSCTDMPVSYVGKVRL